MHKSLPILITTTLLATGCSTPTPENKPKYDELQLVVWQSCINAFIKDHSGFYSTYEILTNRAVEACNELQPVKK